VALDPAEGAAPSAGAVEDSTDRAHAPTDRAGPRACVVVAAAAAAADGADRYEKRDWEQRHEDDFSSKKLELS
jgi:hypothetical protein